VQSNAKAVPLLPATSTWPEEEMTISSPTEPRVKEHMQTRNRRWESSPKLSRAFKTTVSTSVKTFSLASRATVKKSGLIEPKRCRWGLDEITNSDAGASYRAGQPNRSHALKFNPAQKLWELDAVIWRGLPKERQADYLAWTWLPPSNRREQPDVWAALQVEAVAAPKQA